MIAICYNSVQHNFFCLFVYTEIILGQWGRGLKGGVGGVGVWGCGGGAISGRSAARTSAFSGPETRTSTTMLQNSSPPYWGRTSTSWGRLKTQ